MKVLYFFSMIIFFVNINAYQPPEYGLFFEGEINTQDNKQPVLAGNINIEKEKNDNGLDSLVYIVKSVSQFLHLTTKQSLPLVINFYSKSNNIKSDFEQIANQLSQKFIFVVIDSSQNAQLTQLLFLFLRYNGFTTLPPQVKYPLLLFCESNAVVVEKGLVHLKKGALKQLINPGDFDKNDVLLKLKELSDLVVK
ncbi:MAG: hypothetical protein ABIF12_03775 [bacterium]